MTEMVVVKMSFNLPALKKIHFLHSCNSLVTADHTCCQDFIQCHSKKTCMGAQATSPC
jgi:hypothetical protein